MTPRRLMRVPAVAEYVGESVAWARAALARGDIPGARKVRGRWMILQDDLDAWLDAGRPERPEPEGERYEPPPRVMSRTVP